MARSLIYTNLCRDGAQSALCERQSRRNGEDLAVPAAGVEERGAGHEHQTAWVRTKDLHGVYCEEHFQVIRCIAEQT